MYLLHAACYKLRATVKTIAFISQKGGSGKSTLAVHMGVAAFQGGRKTAIVDTDPQESTAMWHRARQAAEPPVATVVVSDLERALTAAKDDRYELALVDSAPHVGPGAGIIARLADLVVVPVQPGPFDIGALPGTIELLRAVERRAVIILSRCPTRSLDVESARRSVLEMNLEIIPVSIGDRAVYRRALAHGLAVTEMDPKSIAAMEITNLYRWIEGQLWPRAKQPRISIAS
jgi:chromosome partitioning protein